MHPIQKKKRRRRRNKLSIGKEASSRQKIENNFCTINSLSMMTLMSSQNKQSDFLDRDFQIMNNVSTIIYKC